MYETIFLKENEKDIFQALQEQDIDTKVFEHKLAHLFNRVYNNYVGYYVFKQDSKIYKLIVLPKTIEISGHAEKDFVSYLLHYYRLNSLYAFDNTKKISNSLLSLAFENNNEEKNAHSPLDEFEFYKYRAILEEIEGFFRRHKNHKRVNVDYVSQSVKYKLNLQRNMKELDKTKIHQTQRKDVVYSIMATITFNALKLFLAHRLEYIKKEYQETLVQETNRLKNFLVKKYNIDKGYKLTLANLQGFKIEKVFSKTDETKHLLVGIKSLFGFEQMYRDSDVSVENRYDLETTSLFINPSNFYEWYVYDILKKYAEENGKTIEFDKKEGTKTEYFLNKKPKSSNPDYILTDEENQTKIVIDAKWKNVNEFGDVKPSDYLKLKFDAFLLEKKGYGVIPYLVYPHINIAERKFIMSLDDSAIFEFNTLEIDMEFEKHGNNLTFDFEVQKLQESIEENSKIEEHKSIAKILSSQVEIKRSSILSKLINAEDNEEREKLKEELDNELQTLGLKLSETVENQELLPEIAEILEEYNDILEDESKKFLQSSSAIYSYYKDKQYENFDYSMPGSGFWKLIELELNTSFIWHIRIESRVCNSSCPWTNISVPNQKVSHRIQGANNVVLNKCEIDNELRLQGIMLGGIRSLSLDENTLNQFFTRYFSANEKSKFFIQNDLAFLIEKVSRLRNEHAHIRAMSLDKFEELWDILFRKNGNEINFLKKLLEFKKSLNEDR